MIRVAISPRSFRQVEGKHRQLLAASGLEPRYSRFDRHLTEDEMVELVSGCEALVVGLDPVTDRVLDAGPLRVVAKYGSGLDNIDLEAARARGVTVAATPGANSQGVAELTLALLFALARNLVTHHESARVGAWERGVGVELAGKKLGVIGLGQVGSRVASMATGMGVQVCGHDVAPGPESVEMVDLDELLEASDAVSLHIPLTEVTRAIVDRGFLRRMRRGALLVNTARGALVDLEAATEELVSGRLGGLAMDDFDVRPSPESPLWSHPAFIASPHAGAATVEAVERTGEAALKVVLEALGG